MTTADGVLLVGHGSSHHPESGRAIQVHAMALRDLRRFGEVEAGLLAGAPAADAVLASMTAPVVHIVPFFMEDGYFTRIAVPRALGLHATITTRSGQSLRYCQPIGTHEGMADVLMARLRACLPDIGRWNVLLVGHGSARAPGRPMALHRHAVRLAAHGITARAAFLEEAPLVQDALAAWRCAPVAILGVFAGEGGHVRDDLPRLIAAERDARGASGQPLAALGSIGEEPGLRRLILDRIGGPPGKVG